MHLSEQASGKVNYQLHLKSQSGPINVLLVNKDTEQSEPMVVQVPPPPPAAGVARADVNSQCESQNQNPNPEKQADKGGTAARRRVCCLFICSYMGGDFWCMFVLSHLWVLFFN